MARKPPPNPPPPDRPSNGPWFCQKCQQTVPAGRAGNHMKYSSVEKKWVLCE